MAIIRDENTTAQVITIFRALKSGKVKFVLLEDFCKQKNPQYEFVLCHIPSCGLEEVILLKNLTYLITMIVTI